MPANVLQLDERLWFPDPKEAVSSGSYRGLVAVGGDLSVERLLLAYRMGIFPWTDNPITWWSPNPRAIFDLGRVHIPRSLEKVRRRSVSLLGGAAPEASRPPEPGRAKPKQFLITRDSAFDEVIAGCANQPRPGQWLGAELIEAYRELYRCGHAHSVECWQDQKLVGGIYGVATGGLFAGESMFHLASNASKVALVALIEHLRDREFVLFDIQMATRVTLQLGAVTISRDAYLTRLASAIELHRAFG